MRPSTCYTTDELVDMCERVRSTNNPLVVEREHLILLQDLASEMRRVREANPGLTSPPQEVARRLRVIGWLMYEVSLQCVQRVPASWESHLREDAEAFASAELCDRFVDHVANSARFLAWREYSPRALGAIRSQALASSKRDTDAGFARAWVLHREVDFLHGLYSQQVEHDPDMARQYLESQVQIRLAETGTACRTAEYVIMQKFRTDRFSRISERARANKIFRDLEAGARFGDEALEKVGILCASNGLVETVDEHGIALDTSYRNPGIMTARAYLLMYPMTTLLEKQGRRTWRDMPSWGHAREILLSKFVAAYHAIEDPISKKHYSSDHRRSIVQLRLNLALICPGFVLRTQMRPELEFAPFLKKSVLDAESVEEMSRWLSHADSEGRKRGDANVIGSATMPSYLESVRLTLGNGGGWDYYVSWRHEWFDRLDRHASDHGRRSIVENALDSANLI